jgi:hypothetical protein
MVEEYLYLKEQLNELSQHNQEIERHLKQLEHYRNDLKRDPIYAKYAYVTHEDLENLSRNKLLRSSEHENELNKSAEILYEDDIEGQ